MRRLVASYNRGDTGGSSYYRIVQIGDGLRARQLINMFDNKTGVSPLADICVWQRACFEEMRQYVKKARQAVHIFDIDDWVFDLPPYMAYSHQHFTEELFRDMIRFMNQCDYVMVTTQYLKKQLAVKTKIALNKFIVMPNYINLLLLPYGTTSNDGKVRMAWCNTAGRQNYDYNVARNGIERILIQYPNSIIVFFGSAPEVAMDYGDQVQVYGFKPIREYYKSIMSQPIDIWLAPAVNSQFNNCRSDIKIIEGGALGLPVVASSIAPYKQLAHEIQTTLGQSPLLLDNWYNNLSKLIEDKQLRYSKGAMLKRFVEQKRSLDVGLQHHLSFYNKIVKPVAVLPVIAQSTVSFVVALNVNATEKPNKSYIQSLKVHSHVQLVLSYHKATKNKAALLNNAISTLAEHDIVVLSEPTLKFLEPLWLEKILAGLETNDIVGIAGSTYYNIKNFSWYNKDHTFDSGSIAYRARQGGVEFTNYGIGKNVIVLSEALIVAKKSIFKSIPFDEQLSQHLYVTDFCIRAHNKGYKLSVVPVSVFYNNTSTFTYNDIQKEQQYFCKKHNYQQAWSLAKHQTMPFSVYFNPRGMWKMYDVIAALKSQSINADKILFVPGTEPIYEQYFGIPIAKSKQYPSVEIFGSCVFKPSALQSLSKMFVEYDAITFPLEHIRYGAYGPVPCPYNAYYVLSKQFSEKGTIKDINACRLVEPIGRVFLHE